MSHSYEEIRAATIKALTGKVATPYDPNQYEHLKIAVAAVLQGNERSDSRDPTLGRQDADIFLEVFWDLFRQGIISLGLDDANREFPFCRVSSLGKRILANEDIYFTHDVSSYEARIKKEIPNIDAVTLLYLKEALQAFRSGCILSATVMLGVATEHEFLLLLETIEGNPKYQAKFAPAAKERTILRKFNKFREILEPQINSLSPDIKEDLDTNFAGVLSIIRNFRNESGHPSGKIIEREQAYVLLQLFVPYCKKMHGLRGHFES